MFFPLVAWALVRTYFEFVILKRDERNLILAFPVKIPGILIGTANADGDGVDSGFHIEINLNSGFMYNINTSPNLGTI